MTAPADDTTARLEAVQAELAATMIPWPDDYMADLTPHAAAFYARQVSMAALKCVASMLVEEDQTDPGDDPLASAVVNGSAAGVAGWTHVLVALGVLPAAAEDAEAGAAR